MAPLGSLAEDWPVCPMENGFPPWAEVGTRDNQAQLQVRIVTLNPVCNALPEFSRMTIAVGGAPAARGWFDVLDDWL
ncbi:MAG: hypothetical protein TE42_10260, partial [Candidatus Synechococcus spongiarum SP3]